MSQLFESIYEKTYQRTDLTTKEKRIAITLLGALIVLPFIVILIAPTLK